MTDILADFEDLVVAVSNVEWKNGVEPVEEINYSAAAAAERWTAGMSGTSLSTAPEPRKATLSGSSPAPAKLSGSSQIFVPRIRSQPR